MPASTTRPILMDGAMGTALEAQGLHLPEGPWSAHAVQYHPHTVRALHAAYARAGATLHTAATFRTQPWIVGERAGPLTRLATHLARTAVPRHHRVAGSMAPEADCYLQAPLSSTARRNHLAMARLLAAAGVDLILVETFANLDEALVATEAALSTGLPVWATLTPGPYGDLLGPRELARGAQALHRAGASVVGVNCLPSARALRWLEPLAALGVPWGVHANAGPRTDHRWSDQPQGPARFAADAKSAWQLGACYVGGCCGTTPLHIAHMDRTLKAS